MTQLDKDTNISFFKEKVEDFISKRNWKQYHKPKDLILALSVEVAELSEPFLFRDYTIEEILDSNGLLETISDEIADVFIYLISLINSLNLNLTQIFNNKMLKNQKKYSLREFNDGSFHKK